MDPITAALGITAAEALPAVAAPSILGGGLTGAGMMTAAPVVPGILTSASPTLLGSLGAMGSAGLNYAANNPLQTAGLGLGIYDRLNAQQPGAQASQLGIIRPQQTGQYQPALQTRIPQATYPRSLL
jgi:hypothetical protein